MFAVDALGILGLIAIEEEERVEELLQRRVVRRQYRIERQRLRDMSNPYKLEPEYFRKLYRMPAHLVMNLVDLVQDSLTQNGNTVIEPHFQVLAALRFFAEGAYQKGVGQDYHHPLSQSTVSRCINDVVNAIVDMADRFILFPKTRQELHRVQERFLERIRIPGIVGIIDCVLVSFVRPVENEEAFYNYKGFHAMNVQIICDADYFIRDIRICPGSNNDRYVWQFSDAKQFLEDLRRDEEFTREEGKFYILGDSGYTPSPVLLTPVREPPEGSAASRYNHEFVRTRCKVEQLFGIFTAVWRCIKRERKLSYRDPVKVSKIITACAVLHNFRRRHGLLDDEGLDEAVIDNDVQGEERVDLNYQAGIAEREEIINRLYN